MAAGQAGRWFLLPGLLFLFAIDLIPLAYSGWVSFYNWWLIRPRDVRFIGLANDPVHVPRDLRRPRGAPIGAVRGRRGRWRLGVAELQTHHGAAAHLHHAARRPDPRDGRVP